MDTTMNTDKAQSKSHSAVDRGAEGARKTADKAADAATPIIERAASGAHRAVDRLFNAAAPAAGWFESKARKLNKSRTEAVQGGKKYVQNYPLATIGAALAAGALIALFMKGRAE